MTESQFYTVTSDDFNHGRHQRNSRVKTGCLTCRRRKKKCDEMKPSCRSCGRNSLHCSWPLHENRSMISKSKSGRATLNQHSGSPTRYLEEATSSNISTLGSKTSNLEYTRKDSQEQMSFRWCPILQSFSAPGRAAALAPESLSLLQHYISNTSQLMISMDLKQNPFMTEILPVAYVDDLLMHAVLAVSGAHLCYQKRSDMGVQIAALRHYSLAICGMRQAIQEEAQDQSKALRMLLIHTMLGYVEAISGNRTGAIFVHLRASRRIILKLMTESDLTKANSNLSLFGFILEAYTFLVLVNTITPYNVMECRTIPFDLDIVALDKFSECSAFGAILGPIYRLLQIAPRISILFAKRLSEEKAKAVSEGCLSEYHALKERIEQCAIPIPTTDGSRLAMDGWRHALIIYLEAAIAGSSVRKRMLVDMQSHAEAICPIVEQMSELPAQNVMLWPLLIAGSCLIDEGHREAIISHLLDNKYQMEMCNAAVELLELLWNDPDEKAFGPYGLMVIMNIHRISVCIA